MSKVVKSIIKVKDRHNIEFYYCSKCKNNVYIISEDIDKYNFPSYCSNCGEELDYDE